jgi:hypothetical protein
MAKAHLYSQQSGRAVIVRKAEAYSKSSAADYYFGKQQWKVKTTFLDPMIKTVK